MKLSFLTGIVTAALMLAQAMPRLATVEPASGKAGDVITASGENLEKPMVEKLYLTDGKNDVELQLTEQAATSVKFKLPASAKPGRFSLMILTGGKEPKLIEQPVKITVE